MPQLSLNGYTYPPSKTSGCNEFTNTHMILKNTNHKKKRGGGDWLSEQPNKWKPKPIILNVRHIHLQKFHSNSNTMRVTLHILQCMFGF